MNTFLLAFVASRSLGLLKLIVVLWLLMVQPVNADSHYSGSWYNPDRDGEGFHIEMLEDNQVMVIWFTFPGPTDDPSAKQAWILGSGTITDNTITIIGANKFQGPEFGPGYNRDNLVLVPWGDLNIVFSGNNNATVNYDGLDGEGTTEVIRITSMAEQADTSRFPVGFSGAWYNPETNGQGWFVEILSDENALVYWFTYDENGNQAWNLEVGFLDGDRIVVPDSKMGRGTVFGNGFDMGDVVREPFADFELTFDGCKEGTAHYRTTESNERDNLPIVRLTELGGKPCKVLAVKAGEGGWIQSASGDNDCLEGQTCFVNLNAEDRAEETFSAVSRTGYEFKGWNDAGHGLCSEGETSCVPSVSGVESDVSLTPIFEPEGSIFFPPKGHVGMCRLENIESYELDCEIKNFESYGYGPLGDYVVTNPYVLFVDVKTRRRELDTLLPETKGNWCANYPSYWQNGGIDAATYTPVPPDDIWNDAALDQMMTPVFFARLYFDYFDDPDAAGLIVRSLRTYAEADVWMDVSLSTDGENRQYNLGLHMYRYLMAWYSVRNDPIVSAKDRRIIDDYLYRLIQLLTPYSGQETGGAEPDLWGDVSNHQSPKDISTMMYGILTSNDLMFQRGIKRFFTILDGTVRPDGSHTYESQRGGSALTYSLGATSELIRFAELAANQGYDLYTVEVNGVSAIDVIEFHVSVLEDETLMHPYSGHNEMFCDGEICDLWNKLRQEPHGWPLQEGWAEFEIFRARFPDSPMVERFQAMFPDNEHVYKQEGPYFQGCEFRDVSTADE